MDAYIARIVLIQCGDYPHVAYEGLFHDMENGDSAMKDYMDSLRMLSPSLNFIDYYSDCYEIRNDETVYSNGEEQVWDNAIFVNGEFDSSACVYLFELQGRNFKD